MIGIKKTSFMNQPTRTTGYTSAIGGGTGLDMHSAVMGPGAISTSFNFDRQMQHTGSITPATHLGNML